MPKNKRIIVGIDGSKYAEAALDKAIEFAKSHDASIHIVNIYNESLQIQTRVASYSEQQVDEARKKAIEPLLKKYAEKVTSSGLKVDANIIVVPGSPGSGLVDTAEKECAMMIVVGVRGLRRIRRKTMGRVSKYVVAHSPCDVLVVANSPYDMLIVKP